MTFVEHSGDIGLVLKLHSGYIKVIFRLHSIQIDMLQFVFTQFFLYFKNYFDTLSFFSLAEQHHTQIISLAEQCHTQIS